MRWRVALAAAALVGVAAGSAYKVHFGHGHTPSNAAPAGRALAPLSAAPPVPPVPQRDASPGIVEQTVSTPRPDAFKGTDIDGSVRVDNAGRVVPTHALRLLFDYYLSGVGQYPGDDPIAAIKRKLRNYALRQALPDTAVVDLLALFDRYMAYRKAAAAYTAERRAPEAEQVLRELSEMRIAYLGADMAEAFYGEQTRRTRAAMARRRGEAGAASLTDTQQKLLAPARLASRVQTLRKNGADAAAVQAARQQAVGRAAAERLEAMDKRRAAWEEQIQAYRNEHARIMASAMAEADRQEAVQALRTRYFTEQQIRRVESLDRLAARRSETQP